MTNIDQDTLSALSCAIGARPVGAPTLDDILPAISENERRPHELLIHFEPGMLVPMKQFAVAERQCCEELDWQVDASDSTLHIGAQPTQLDILAELFAKGVPS